MRPLLSSLGNLIHDKAERVRIAAVRMLIRIKQIRGIRFYHVVPVDHLTARFTEETRLHRSPRNAVARELTALMLNSYFPHGSNVSASAQLQRTLTFLLTDPDAAAVFYANLADHLEVESVAKFIVMLLACLKSAVDEDEAQQVKKSKKHKKRRRRASEHDEDNSGDSEEQNLSASNTALMASLTGTIDVLWESIDGDLSDPFQDGCRALLVNRFVKANAVQLLSHFQQKVNESDSQTEEDSSRRDDCWRTCSAILRCASRLPQERIEGIVSFVISSLQSSAGEGRGSCAHLSSHLALLCTWERTEIVASTLAKSIESAFGEDISLMSPCFGDNVGRRSSRSIVGNTQVNGESFEIPKFPPQMAWQILDAILKASDPSSAAVRDAILSSTSASNNIIMALERGTIFAERLLAADLVSFQTQIVKKKDRHSVTNTIAF